jgi:excisionase family DNA binding protein
MPPTIERAQEYLTVAEAALRARVCAGTIRKLVRDKLLRALRPTPDRIVIRTRDLDAYLEGTAGGGEAV